MSVPVHRKVVRVRDRVVVVGGAGAIGAAIVEEYHRSNHQVVIGDINEEAAAKLVRDDGSVSFLKVDVTKVASIIAFGEGLRGMPGGITHLVSLAGGALEA